MRMAQAGQYNLPRCLQIGDNIAAMLACAKFAEEAMSLNFLLNRRYMPYYKLAPRILPQLPMLGENLHILLDFLAASPLEQASAAIEQFCGQCAALLQALNLSLEEDAWLWLQGPVVARRIANPDSRRRNLLDD